MGTRYLGSQCKTAHKANKIAGNGSLYKIGARGTVMPSVESHNAIINAQPLRKIHLAT